MLFTILQVVYIGVQIYSYVFLFYIFLSYFKLGEDNPLVKITDSLCVPVHSFFLRILPPIHIGMFDLSPLYVLIFIQVLQIILGRLMEMAR